MATEEVFGTRSKARLGVLYELRSRRYRFARRPSMDYRTTFLRPRVQGTSSGELVRRQMS
jgi:hypothetical protein